MITAIETLVTTAMEEVISSPWQQKLRYSRNRTKTTGGNGKAKAVAFRPQKNPELLPYLEGVAEVVVRTRARTQ